MIYPASTRRPARGFTLIELTLVTVIILALLGLSIPLFRKTFSDFSAKDTAFNISKLISYAQERSIIDRKKYKIVFDFQLKRYQLVEPFSQEGKVIYRNVPGRFGKAFKVPQGLFFGDPAGKTAPKKGEEYKKEIALYPDGRSDELLLDILYQGGSGYRITAKGFGSLVHIKEIAGVFQ